MAIVILFFFVFIITFITICVCGRIFNYALEGIGVFIGSAAVTIFMFLVYRTI